MMVNGWVRVRVMVLVMVLVMVMVMDEMDEAMMKHFTYSPSLSPLI